MQVTDDPKTWPFVDKAKKVMKFFGMVSTVKQLRFDHDETDNGTLEPGTEIYTYEFHSNEDRDVAMSMLFGPARCPDEWMVEDKCVRVTLTDLIGLIELVDKRMRIERTKVAEAQEQDPYETFIRRVLRR